MEVWMTRQRNGQYMLTKYKPIMAQVEGRDYVDAYVLPGEPVGVRNLCDALLRILDKPVTLKRGESILIELSGRVIEMFELCSKDEKLD
tara:strand:- start:526 stop:792 length:267 start_codon:yes stop_codon:yes gene_type:complete